MKHLSARRGAAGLLVVSTALLGLTAVPSPADAASGLDGDLRVDLTFAYEGAGCSTPGAADSPVLAFTDTGKPVTQSWSDTRTSVAGGNPADITDLRGAGAMTVSASPIRAAGTTVKGTVRVSASVLPRLATTACKGRARAQSQAFGVFTLPAPMWVTVAAQGSGRGALQAVAAVDGEPAVTIIANRGTGSTTSLLPAGEADLTVLALAEAATAGPRSTSYTGSFSIRFAPLGEASPVSGKGRGHVRLGARSCAGNTVAAALTAKARKAKKVVVTVNGAKGATFQGRKLRKRAFSVRVASGAKAQVAATITLKNGRKLTVSRSYLACS